VSLVVLTGAVRSGKSSMAEELAASRGSEVVVAVAGWDGDGEMTRRIAAHRLARPAGWTTVLIDPDPGWVAQVPDSSLLLLDCLGTLVSTICFEEVGEVAVAAVGVEQWVSARVTALIDALLARSGDTIVVTNEVGWGVVPAWASARLFRDELGRANRRLIDTADGAWLIVAGKCHDLGELERMPIWPS